MSFNNVPQELRACPQWLVWKLETRGGKPTKVPYCAADPSRRASSTDPETWATFDQACAAAPNATGIGFVFSGDDPYIGVDLDKCFADGALQPWAQAIIDKLNSYTELTPSGNGLHVIIKGELPPGKRRRGSVEMYEHGRFFTVTGNVLADFADNGVEHRQAEISDLHAELFADDPKPNTAPPTPGDGFGGDDADLIERAKRAGNGQKFARLWNGDTSVFDGDKSSGDLALCQMLAFWTGRDASRIDRLFRQSGRMREKWNSRRGGSTWGAQTIERAIANTTEVFDGGMTEEQVAAYLERMSGMPAGAIQARVNGTAPTPAPAVQTPAQPAQRAGRKPYVSNVVNKQDDDGEATVCYVSPQVMSATLTEGTGGWPKSANGMIFVPQTRRSHDDEPRLPDARDVRFLRTSHALHAWIHEEVDLHFTATKSARKGDRTVSPVNKSEFFEHVISAVERHSAVEMLPHEPPIADVYYWNCPLPEPTGDALAELRRHLNAETDIDRDLMIAALLTPGWGGPSGARPAFVFTSSHGRGAGKTKTAELFAQVWGGFISIGEDEDWQQVKTRLLSDESLTTRVVMIDNLKGRLSRSGLESAITAVRIDGRRLYVGQASRPNLLTWYITANTPELSRDLAERSAVIKVGQPKHGSDFESWSKSFLEHNRPQLIADLMAVLRGPDRCDPSTIRADRWRMWQCGVLAKLPNGAQIAEHIISTRPEVDTDSSTAAEVAGVFRALMENAGYDPDHEQAIFPTKFIHEHMIDAGLRSKGDHPQRTTGWIKHMLDIEPARSYLSYTAAKVNGRAQRVWKWGGPECDADSHIHTIDGSAN